MSEQIDKLNEQEKVDITPRSSDGYTHKVRSYHNDDDDESVINISDINPKNQLCQTKSNQNEPDIASPPYSRFGTTEKMILVIQCAFTGFFSSIAGAIYYPVLSVIENEFNITEEMVNITVVVYFIFQGIAPSIMGGLADSMGRRPVVLSSVLVYCCACIGLACSHTYAQIIVLRCLQAAGISPVIAINSGIMGDITTRAERGGYVGYVSGFQVIGSAFGALIGAGLSATWSWRSIFWFLAIGSGVCLVASIIILPETKRTVVGNGSIMPPNRISRAPSLYFPPLRRKLHLDNPDLETKEPHINVNIFASFKILTIPEVTILLFVAGLQFSTNTVHQTALSTVLSKRYGLTVAKIGLCYLPSGICTLISVVTSGRYLNWIYRRRMAAHNKWIKEQEAVLLEQNNHDIDAVREIIATDSKYTFNIFKARLEPALVTLLLSASGYVSFGWCISVKAPLAAVLVTSGFGSLFSNCILTFSSTLIVDLFPSKSSTATACLNLFRCLMSAILIACLSKMSIAMTYGGVFTFLGALAASSSLLLLFPIRHGKALALKRRKEEEALLISKNVDSIKSPV
ncbi:MFS transporter NDAI_0B03770 [Naumovozyma dairenensis CBS 421]|uniref:Major facilitator superfamily (MFS) profile domain-containing protein n=1 Tax=Naumovozyma dairenensis (strain ATCC 10597 / BCRC 20456 / CBS 421 / NBRC 0211 / NRRL Y-12639) TaxID=1071378 RepID=G0W6K0_NAUDC|nr:hypothetical protein NDAI_0B03770 [Naumovozyma dairenensis CBS 421]CCD23411.1 hypothetical protein NDAI_0B03770 [Naumovozyma dairenensis CBS 421]